jgi:aspartokinase-like uncharacterized kinase
MPAETSTLVVKVGGSLYDLPDLRATLNHWLQSLSPAQLILVPGGGRAADVVRELDQCHSLGEEKAHWLALAAMSLKAHFLRTLIPCAELVAGVHQCQTCWREQRVPILDAYRFALLDEGRPGFLPHSWDVTSDSIAARVATVFGATELILLKSIEMPAGLSWVEASQQGHVDRFFDRAAAGLTVKVINFRALPY